MGADEQPGTPKRCIAVGSCPSIVRWPRHLRILAEPTLTTLTGQEAEFLSGGEFPIPVPQDFARTTVEFKDFGVGLRFLPVVLDEDIMDDLFRAVEETPGYRLHVDLEDQTVTTPDGHAYGFEVDAFKKYSLLNGLDEIGLTMQHLRDIRDYESRRRKEAPWLFAD